MPISRNPLPSKALEPKSTSRKVVPQGKPPGARELPKRPTGRLLKSTQSPMKTGSMINISVEPKEDKSFRKSVLRSELPVYSKVKKTTLSRKTPMLKDARSNDHEKEIFYSSDSELSHEEQQLVKQNDTKVEQSMKGQLKPSMRKGKYFEEPDSGFAISRRESFNSRNSSSLDRSSSVSLEEKLYEMEMSKLRKMSELRSDYFSEDDPNNNNSDSKRSAPAPSQFVGFGLLPDQVYSKAVRKGFEFSLMVVGASGLGKSTLVNSMFLADIYERENQGTDTVSEQTLQVETHHSILEENGVRLSLTVVDTPGFGENVDNSECWHPIVEYIDEQFDNYLEGETRVERVEVSDTRVHACLYFIAPTGHGLKPLDVEVMRRIHDKVNIIPVIGKADSCTRREINLFKNKILLQLEKHEIHIYDFPASELEPEHHWMRGRLPFAVVGSNTIVTDDEGNMCRGREYPWGNVNIEDKDHCDFLALRNLVLAHHMQDLKETTHSNHYENFRCEKLREMMGGLETKNKTQHGEEDLDQELRQNFQDLENEKMKPGRKNSFMKQKKLWDMKPKSLESILGGNKMRNIMSTMNLK